MAGNSPTVIVGSLNDDELKKSIDKLVNHVDTQLQIMVSSTKIAVDSMNRKLKTIGQDVTLDLGTSLKKGVERQAKELSKTTQESSKVAMTYDQIADATQRATQSASKYTDEVKKQAAAIRSMKQWQEKGHVFVGEEHYYDPEKSNVSKNAKKILLSLEEQILEKKHQQSLEATVAAEAERQQAQAAKEAAEAANRKTVFYKDIGFTEDTINKSSGRLRQEDVIRQRSQDVQSLRDQLSSLLEIEDREIKAVNTESASYNQLSMYLKQLQTAYQRLGSDRIAKNEGTDLANEIQRVQRAMQKLQSTMSRPTSLKEAMGLSEKTLDDIAYKMRQLASYRMGLDVATQKDEISRVSVEYDRLKKRQDEILGRNTQMIASNNALTRSFNYMKNRLAFYFTVGASTAFVKSLIDIRSQYEMNERALGILINSAERGTQIFKELSQMALVSPYTLIELSTAAKQLTAYDIAAKDVVDTTRRLADMASAVGVPIERLTYALGQIKAYGYLNSRDQRMFANAGIPLAKQLADYYTQIEGRLVSTADVYDRIKKKAVDYADVVQVINKMTDEGGKFYNFQEKMAETLKVQLANLTLAWNNMMNDIGESDQGWISGTIGGLKNFFVHWRDINKILNDVAVTIGVAVAANMLLNKILGKGVITGIKSAQMWGVETNAVYRNILSKKNLTKEQAQLVVALNKGNKMLKAEIVNMKLLSQAEVEAAVKMKGTTVAWKLFTSTLQLAVSGIAAVGRALAAILPQLAVFAAISAIVDLVQTIQNRKEAVKEFNEEIQRNAKESAKTIRETLSSLDFADARKLNAEQQIKAWEILKERIEDSAAASQQFVAGLLTEADMGERVNAARELLEKIASVHELMVRLGEDGILITQDFKVLGVGADGLKTDISDFVSAMKEANEETARLAGKTSEVETTLRTWAKWIYDVYDAQIVKPLPVLDVIFAPLGVDKKNEVVATYEEMMFEMGKTAEDLKKKLDSEYITDPLMIREAMEKTLIASGLTGRELVTARIALERKMRELYESEISQMTDFERKKWDENFGYRRAAVEDFLKYARSQDSQLFSNLTEEEIKNGSWLTAERQKKLDDLLEKYKTVNALAYQDLEQYVGKANGLSVYIPVIFNLKNAPSDVQKDFMSRTGFLPTSGEYSEYAKNAKSQVEIISNLKKAQTDKAKEVAAAEKAGGDYAKNNLDRLKNENKALVNMIHSYGTLTDEEEKAQNKGRGGGSKKDEILDALKQEIDLVKRLQSDYDKLTKAGASSADAFATINESYGNTIKLLNSKLGSLGIPQISMSLFEGKDPNKIEQFFKGVRDTLTQKGLSNLERMKAVEAVVEEFTLSAKTYNLDKITKGLNNELGKLKDEYELAVELDANPEMGNLFADWMGIDMSTLPHTAEEYAKRMTKALNKYLADEKSGIEIGSLLALTDDDLRMFQQRADNGELAQVWVDNIVKNTKEARNALKKENSDIAKDWDNLVQKYAEYEYKIAQVQRNANKERKAFALKYGSNAQKERALVLTTEIDAEKDQAKKQELINQLKQLLAEIAGDDDSKLKIKVAIDQKELEEGAKVAFEEFQKSPEWIVATGDLAGLTDKALGGLISSLEEYKKKAKYLNPKQIKQLNKALIDLYKKQREGNPFKALSTAMMESKERVSVYEDELRDTQNELNELSKKQAESFSEDRGKKIDELIERIKDLKQKIKDGLKLDPKDVVEGIGAMIAVAKQASEIFTEMFDSLGVSKEITQQIEGVFTVLDKGIQGAQTGAAIGGEYGAIIGGVIGVFTGLASVLFGGGKDDITLAIERSERSVKQLEIAYKRLDVAIEEAYGAAKWGAEQAAIANKKLQLAELKRQLALERSRDSKDRDEGKINDLMGQIEDLKIEIEKAIKDITNDLLGISSVGNAAEELVSSMIDAFRKGEDYMLHYDQTFEEMINNMVMKAIVGRVIGDRLQSLWDRVDAVAKEKGEPYKKQIEELTAAKKANEDSIENLNSNTFGAAALNKAYFDKFGITLSDMLKQANERIDEEIKKLQKQYSDAIAPTPEDVQSIRDDAANWRDSVKSEFDAYMELFGIKFGDTADGKQLSSLQQGIQGVTEDTAGAIEAYLNGMSQQAYLRNDILVEIRDTIQSFDMDVQVAVFGQILLQLQASYQAQMAIRGMLEGWSNPSGQAVRVEMI